MSSVYRALLGPLWEMMRDRLRTAPDPQAKPAGIGLALGGGFARGFAHIGALETLERHAIRVACVAGTSVGSILGAAYASGVAPGQIADVCRRIRFKDFARWRISKMGLASNDRMAEVMRRWFGSLTFEEMKIPFAVVATNLGTGDPEIFRSGSIIEPVRASCAFPGLFEPVMIGGRCYADGGLVAPLPTRAAALLGASRVVAIDVGFSNWRGVSPRNLFQVLCRSINAAQKHRSPSWEKFADLVISPAVKDLEWDSFDRADEAIAAGREAAERALPRIRQLLQSEPGVSGDPSPAAA